ncbi:MAG: threonylcarbamoyl-AMP synthase [Deltaproteobacteria bacterium]|nr:threonylcarbamoyl-AMP synthase [Deltaproteobacteria bacterium]
MHPEPELIRVAALILKKGGLVAFPTETVYGLGALALHEETVRKIFAAKGRPATNPLIVHVLDEAMAKTVCATWPEQARAIAEALWPGPLTLILPRRDIVPLVVTAGLAAVAVRSPAHPVARALLAEVAEPIAAPSANLYTEISPTRAEHVRKGLSGKIDLILDGGPAGVGVESTVLDLTGPVPTILRPGAIVPSQIERVIGRIAVVSEHVRDEHARPSPGQSKKHYAPKAQLAIVAMGDAGLMQDRILRVRKLRGRVGVLIHSNIAVGQDGLVLRRLPKDPKEYAAALYDALHDLEDAGCSHILVEAVPPGEAWDAARDRLKRASA